MSELERESKTFFFPSAFRTGKKGREKMFTDSGAFPIRGCLLSIFL